MGYASVCTPLLGQWIPWIWSQVSSLKHSAVWRNQVECGAYSNSNIQNISRRNGLPVYMCKSRSQHARIEVCPSMNMSKHQAKAPLMIPTLCIIFLCSWTWGKKTEWKAICDPRYSLKQWRHVDIPYSINRRSLSEWTTSKQTWDLMALGWSHDSDRNVGQRWKVNEMMGNKGPNTQ